MEPGLDPQGQGWLNDSDQDGVPDDKDNCPRIANRDQTNCDAYMDGATPLGDACDPDPCPALPSGPLLGGATQALAATDALSAGPLPWIHVQRSGGGPVRIPMRLTGFDTTHPINPRTYATVPKGVMAKYCACHELDGSKASEDECRNTFCPDFKSVARSLVTDTGFNPLIWKLRNGECPLIDDDLDGSGSKTGCGQAVPSTRFTRTFGARGTPMCTARGEGGCKPYDNTGFWIRDGNATTVTWPWSKQEYPHPPETVHDIDATTWAYVRVWIQRGDEAEAARPDPRVYSSFSEPMDLTKSPIERFVIARPIYDKRDRWRISTPLDPFGPLTILTPIPLHGEAPESWRWPEQPHESATQGLVASGFSALGATIDASRPSVFYGDGDGGLRTTAFGAARFEEAVFVFGGVDGDQKLSAGLWMGFANGDEQSWQPVEGAMARLASVAKASASSPAAAKKPIKVLPAHQRYGAWLAKVKAKRGTSRAPLSAVAATSAVAFQAAMTRYQSAKAAQASAATSAKLGSSSVQTRSPQGFGAGEPLAQKNPAVIGNQDDMLLVMLFGEPESQRGADDPVPVAVWDLASSQWVVGEVSWSCGPRYEVGHTASDGVRSIVFYGGKIGDTVVDGLFIKELTPEALFEGLDVTRLDAEAAERGLAPGPRANAVLTYDPLNRLVYLFGGDDAAGQAQNDLWVFSRDDARWRRLSAGSEEQAPARALAAGLVLSPLDGSLTVVGGAAAEGNPHGFWRWDGSGWEILRKASEESP